MAVSWADVARAAPVLAASARESFERSKHATMATVRMDGAPRISGTEVDFAPDGEVYVAMMPGTRRADDLRRDPRMALHSPTVEAGGDGPWSEAKIDARAAEVEENRFRLDVGRVTVLEIVDGALEVAFWTPGGGVARTRRA